jgi:hypothetical protein
MQACEYYNIFTLGNVAVVRKIRNRHNRIITWLDIVVPPD